MRHRQLQQQGKNSAGRTILKNIVNEYSNNNEIQDSVYNKLQIYKDILEHYSTEIKKIITKNDIYLNYFIEYIFIDYNEFNFCKLIDYKKLPTVNSWLSSTN